MSQTRFFARSAGLYGAGSALQHSATFLLLPAILHKLKPDDYGWVALGDAILALAVPVATLALPGAVTRFYHAWREEPERESFIRVLWSAQLLIAGLLAALLILLGPPGADRFVQGFPWSEAGPWLVATIALTAAAQTPLALLRIREQVKPLIGCNCLSTFTTLATALYLLYYREGTVLAVFQANTVGAGLLCFGTSLAARLAPGLPRLSHQPLWSTTTAFAIPAIPGAVVETLYGNVERFVLNAVASPAVVGLYVAAHDLARGLIRLMVHTALKPAWQPFCIRMLSIEPNKGRRLIHRLSPLVIVAGCVATSATALFPGELMSLFASTEYQASVPLVPWLGLVNLIIVFDLLALIGSIMSNRTGLGSAVSMIQAGVSLGGNLLLVPLLGAWGALLAFLLSTIAWVGGKFWISARYYPVAFPIPRLALLASLPIALALFGLAVPSGWMLPWSPLGFAIRLLLFGGGLFFLVRIGIDADLRRTAIGDIRQRLGVTQLNRKNAPPG
jgi:O-antigen/teichoic acid export membrane protein